MQPTDDARVQPSQPREEFDRGPLSGPAKAATMVGSLSVGFTYGYSRSRIRPRRMECRSHLTPDPRTPSPEPRICSL